jgi:C1A family cysteine protease
MKGHEVLICGNSTAEVAVAAVRHAINLGEKICSCWTWQTYKKPCNHALAVIAKISSEVNMKNFVHYYSVERFKKAYEGIFKPMRSQEQ